MANPEHLKILKQGIPEWNIWRERNPLIKPNLSRARLKGMTLFKTHLFGKSTKPSALAQILDLSEVNLNKADLRNSLLIGTNLVSANLSNANLRGAMLIASNISNAILTGADFTGSDFGGVNIGMNDLSKAIGLESITHSSPSFISTETLYRSGGKIPKQFLQGSEYLMS